MRFDTEHYTVGHSTVSDNDIIIGDRCGRYVPVHIESVPEVISMLQMLVSMEDSDVNPDEFEKVNARFEALQKFGDEYMADEDTDSATYLKDLMYLDLDMEDYGPLLRWKHNYVIVDELADDVYAQILRELESEA